MSAGTLIDDRGVTATHAVVQAQLVLDGTAKGPHLFIVQLRDRATHRPMRGIEISDQGSKAHGSFAALDNGFIRFDHVRIPHSHMLARFAQVTPDGKYVAPPHAKASYGGMIFIRAQMISNSGWSLAKAATIAIRYAHVRRQFKTEDSGELQQQVIKYTSVFMRLVPVLAQAYAFITVGKAMADLFNEFASQQASGSFELLAETHAVSSGLKAYVTSATVQGCETSRRACGGHGMMESAGIGRIFAAELPSATYEGDNYVLAMQPSRAAMKALQALRKDRSLIKTLAPSNAYLALLFEADAALSTQSDWRRASSADILRALDLRAGRLVERLDALASVGKRSWNSLSWECQRVYAAIVESFIANRLVEALEEPEGHLRGGLGESERDAVAKLMHFYMLHMLENALPDLFELALIAPSRASDSTAETLREAVRQAAIACLPNLIGLVDAFQFSDLCVASLGDLGTYRRSVLDSDLGRYDGDYVNALIARARADRVRNQGTSEQQHALFKDFIEPILVRGENLCKL